MNTMSCINCTKDIIIIDAHPTTKYWISDPDNPKYIKYVLCGAQCATDYKERVDHEAK